MDIESLVVIASGIGLISIPPIYVTKWIREWKQSRNRIIRAENTQSYHSPLTSNSFTSTARNYELSSKTLRIAYLDGNYDLTHRDIRISKSRTFKPHYVNAYCLFRNEERDFKISRIKECIDLETGELIADVQKFISDFCGKTIKNDEQILKNGDLLLLVEYRNASGFYEKKRLSVGKRFNRNDGLLKAWWVDNPDENDRQQTVIALSDIAKMTDLITGQVIIDKERFMLNFLGVDCSEKGLLIEKIHQTQPNKKRKKTDVSILLNALQDGFAKGMLLNDGQIGKGFFDFYDKEFSYVGSLRLDGSVSYLQFLSILQNTEIARIDKHHEIIIFISNSEIGNAIK